MKYPPICAGAGSRVHSLKLTDQVLTGALSYLLMFDEGAAEQLVAASFKPVTPSGESPAGGVFRAGRAREWEVLAGPEAVLLYNACNRGRACVLSAHTGC